MKITVLYNLNEVDSPLAEFTTNFMNLFLHANFLPNLYYVMEPIDFEYCEPLMLCQNIVTKEYKIFKKSTIDAYFSK